MRPTTAFDPVHQLFLDFPGVPGGASMLIVLLFAATLIAYRLASIVYTDAQDRGHEYALVWALATALGIYLVLIPGLIVILLYMLQRNPKDPESTAT